MAAACDPPGTPHGLTINSFSSLSLEPPLVMVAIDRSCDVLARIEASGAYAVNMLRDDQEALSERFSCLLEGRFEGIEWRAGATDSPILKESVAWMECRIVQAIDAGDHRVLIGEVVDAGAGDGNPLLFFGSEYRLLK